MSFKSKTRLSLILSAVGLTAVFVLSLCFGSAQMSFEELLFGLLKKDGFLNESAIIYSMRLPRALGGVLSGAALSVSGVILQAVTGNSLASPNIIGVNAGAGFCTLLIMAFIPAAAELLPLGAFFGAFVTTMLILFVSTQIGMSKSTLILCGVAVNALLNGAISFLSYFDNDLLVSYKSFSVGGLANVSLSQLKMPFIITVIGLLVLLFLSSRLDTLCLGDSIAVSLGVNVKALRIGALVIASALAGAAVSFCGLLGFVGLVVPHTAKKLCGGDMKHLLPLSALLGGTLVTLSDLLGRTLLRPTEIPVGIIMAFIGAPFFFGLLIKKGGKENA